MDETVDVTGKKPSFFGTMLKNAFPMIGGVVQGLLDYRAQKKSMQRNLQTQQELAKYRYEKDREMYENALAYNTPAQQMQRFKDAGLNPNLIYSRGDSGNAPAVMPKYPEMSADMQLPSPVKIPNLSKYYDTVLQREQIKQAQLNTDLLNGQKSFQLLEYGAKSAYIFEEAYARAKQAGYKGDKADFDKFVLNNFKDIAQSAQINKWGQEGAKYDLYTEDVKKRKIDTAIQQKNLDFLNMGLPWMLPLNMFLSTFLKMR